MYFLPGNDDPLLPTPVMERITHASIWKELALVIFCSIGLCLDQISLYVPVSCIFKF